MSEQTLEFFFIKLALLSLLAAGCAGPLDTATKQALVADFSGEVYQAKVYLGNHRYLPYTNNSVDGRSPTGIFIDRSLDYSYQTDAGFFESGSSGHKRSLKRLRDSDRDMNFGHFAQGIQAGQLVKMTRFADKSDQLIVYIETLGHYHARKDYRSGVHSHSRPRESRIHCVLGKEGMQTFDRTTLEQMLDRLLIKVPPLITETQKREFVLANYPATPLPDLREFTGLSTSAILNMYYANLFSQRQLPLQAQQKFVRLFSAAPARWYHELGILLRTVELGGNNLKLNCEIQEISNSLFYYTPELRAGLLFFDGVIPLAESLQTALFSDNGYFPFDRLLVTFFYLYFDQHGRRFDEELTVSTPMQSLQRFFTTTISEQELADRSQILLGSTPLHIHLSAQEAVENMEVEEATGWKWVDVEIEDSRYKDDESGDAWIITGTVVNSGNWIAKDVTVTVKGYHGFGIFAKRKESKTLDGLLKPGETKEFTITLDKRELERFKLSVTWKVVE